MIIENLRIFCDLNDKLRTKFLPFLKLNVSTAGFDLGFSYCNEIKKSKVLYFITI